MKGLVDHPLKIFAILPAQLLKMKLYHVTTTSSSAYLVFALFLSIKRVFGDGPIKHGATYRIRSGYDGGVSSQFIFLSIYCGVSSSEYLFPMKIN